MIIENDEMDSVRALSELSDCNPFVPRRIELEREVLGSRFVWSNAAWHKRQDLEGVPPNIDLMTEVAEQWSETFRTRLVEGRTASEKEREIYSDIVLYLVYNTFQESFRKLLEEQNGNGSRSRCHAPFYEGFRDRLGYYFESACPAIWANLEPAHLFACFYQLRRAFHYIYGNILGGSMASAQLRASVWESIFSHDMKRYRRNLYRRMTDISTLITGPSGTGKELVAQAIGYSRYIGFNESSKQFEEDYRSSFYPVNLSALAPTLIESELFGHRKGSFTGALDDRTGWFGLCSEQGSVFLDEIGETSPDIQVKLLRVLQSRTFQQVGDAATVQFHGKVIVATNRDLVNEIQKGNFREDLYYRLCADLIETPDLYTQLSETPEQLQHFLLYIARQVAGEDESELLASETETFIHDHLDEDYRWPGNVRELEQCVRSVLIRRRYVPFDVRDNISTSDLGQLVVQGTMSLDELDSRYISMIYARTENYEETGRRLGLDGRTVKAKVKREYVEPFEG